MRLPTYDKPRIIDKTSETSEYISIPRGCEDDLLWLLKSVNADYIVEDKRNDGIKINVEFNGTLYHLFICSAVVSVIRWTLKSKPKNPVLNDLSFLDSLRLKNQSAWKIKILTLRKNIKHLPKMNSVTNLLFPMFSPQSKVIERLLCLLKERIM